MSQSLEKTVVSKTQWSTRELVTIAVFGTLWGIVEIFAGSLLKSLRIPMAGMFLCAVGISLALMGRLFVPRKGTILFIAVVALLLKLFSIGAARPGPMIAILMEALIAELTLLIVGRQTKATNMLVGVLAVFWTLAHPFVVSPILYGTAIYEIWFKLIQRITNLFGMEAIILMLLIYLLIHVVVGCVAGFFSWEVGHQIARRIRPPVVSE